MYQPQEDENGRDATNVLPFARPPDRNREPPPTDEEIAEYRRIRPLLLQMLEEWKTLKGAQGCPVMRGILGL